MVVTPSSRDASSRRPQQAGPGLPARPLKIVIVIGRVGRRHRRHRGPACSERVRLIRQGPRAGKTSALNLAMPHARAKSSSSRTPIRSTHDTVARLINSFADPDVGYVTGRMVYKAPDGSLTGEGCSLYMRYENRLRDWETKLGSIVGVDGGVDAMRRDLYRPMRAGSAARFRAAAARSRTGLPGGLSTRSAAVRGRPGRHRRRIPYARACRAARVPRPEGHESPAGPRPVRTIRLAAVVAQGPALPGIPVHDRLPACSLDPGRSRRRHLLAAGDGGADRFLRRRRVRTPGGPQRARPRAVWPVWPPTCAC